MLSRRFPDHKQNVHIFQQKYFALSERFLLGTSLFASVYRTQAGSPFLRSTDASAMPAAIALDSKGYIFFFTQLLIRLQWICLTYFFLSQSLIQLLGILQVMILFANKGIALFSVQNFNMIFEISGNAEFFHPTNRQRNERKNAEAFDELKRIMIHKAFRCHFDGMHGF